MPEASKRVLLTGCTGFIGQCLTRELLQNGYKVFGVARDGNKARSAIEVKEGVENLTIFEGDLLHRTGQDQLRQQLSRVDGFEAVIHTVGGGPLTCNDKFAKQIFDLNFTTTHNLVQLLDETNKCESLSLFVYFSSLAAMGLPPSQDDTILYTESSPCEPVLAYEQAKCKTEEFLARLTAAYSFKTVVLRLPQVYGGSNDPLIQVVNLMRKGAFPVVRNKVGSLPLIHVGDVASATALLLANHQLLKTQYAVTLLCERSYSYDDLKDFVRAKYGKGNNVHVPYALFYPIVKAIEMSCRLIGKAEPLNTRRLVSMTKKRVVQCNKFVHTFGFKFAHSVATHIADTMS
jgi:nucleoside-diphosphate-sugar epimerase